MENHKRSEIYFLVLRLIRGPYQASLGELAFENEHIFERPDNYVTASSRGQSPYRDMPFAVGSLD